MVKLFNSDFSRADLERLVGNLSQLFGIEAAEYSDGAARGMRFLDVRSGGGLRFLIHPDRGLDIGHAEFDGVPIAWRSVVGPIHPGLIHGEDRNSFQRGFGGGLLVTCGLRHYGHQITNSEETFPTHGRVHSLCAESIRWGTEWLEDTATLWVEGVVRETRSSGEHLEMLRRFEVPVGEGDIRIIDTVTNRSFRSESIAVLHHINFGFPLVDDRVLVRLNQSELTLPPGVSAKIHESKGGGEVIVNNPNVPFELSLSFSHPALLVWRNPDPGMNVLGVEPASHNTLGWENEEKQKLDPGDSIKFQLHIRCIRLNCHIQS